MRTLSFSLTRLTSDLPCNQSLHPIGPAAGAACPTGEFNTLYGHQGDKMKMLRVLCSFVLFLVVASFSNAADHPTLFLDYPTAIERPITLQLNPADFSQDWLKDPFPGVKNGNDIWIGMAGHVVVGKFVKSEIEKGRVRGDLKVEVQASEQISQGWFVLSLKQLPKQQWKKVDLGETDRAFVKKQIKEGPNSYAYPPTKIKSPAGIFLLVNEEMDEEGEFVSFRTVLFHSEQGSWKKINEFIGQGVEAVIDIDGDGFPEVSGGTGYKSFVLRRIYPAYEELVTNTSGV
jgi:hypothetical protein